jgi:hypothetical protein
MTLANKYAEALNFEIEYPNLNDDYTKRKSRPDT